MKVYLSADIEGITTVTHWDETDIQHAEYAAAHLQITHLNIAGALTRLAGGAAGAATGGRLAVWQPKSFLQTGI
jgi:D-aminopeptidase